jgi:hypothetical protein
MAGISPFVLMGQSYGIVGATQERCHEIKGKQQ